MELRRQLDEMKLIAEDKSTELELRKANDTLDQLRSQLDTSEKLVCVIGRRRSDFERFFCQNLLLDISR